MGREVMEGLHFLASLPLAGTRQREGGGFSCINKWDHFPSRYSECCLADVLVKSERYLLNSIQNSSISGA